MNARLRSKAVAMRRKRTEVADDDRWAWGAIFTAVALTGLCVAPSLA